MNEAQASPADVLKFASDLARTSGLVSVVAAAMDEETGVEQRLVLKRAEEKGIDAALEDARREAHRLIDEGRQSALRAIGKADEKVADATAKQAEADRIISNARDERVRLIADGQAEADRLVAEAKAEAKRVTGLVEQIRKAGV